MSAQSRKGIKKGKAKDPPSYWFPDTVGVKTVKAGYIISKKDMKEYLKLKWE